MTQRSKITLAEVLLAVDNDSKEVWEDLTDEQKKKDINLFTLNRYLSCITRGTAIEKGNFVMYCNELYNKHMYTIMKDHPQLLWQLGCMVANAAAENPPKGDYYDFGHRWIGLKRQKNKKVEFLANLFPDMKIQDVETLAAVTSNKEVKQYCEQLGWDKKQIKSIKL